MVKGFRSFGGQDGYVIPVAVLHKSMDVIDGSLQSASPCPPELLIIMAPRYSDPGNIQRSRHTRLPKSGAMDRVTTGYAEHRIPETGMVQNGLRKS